jgi:CheY-like chemotaxis protein
MSAATRRILFVDSDESLRLLVQRVLARFGIAVEAVADAPAAIRQLAAEKYQVVVVDLLATGGEAYAIVRALAMIPAATRPIVIATGDPVGDPRLDAEVISLIVRKPYDVQALSEMIVSSMSLEIGRGMDARDEGLSLC